MLHDNRRKGALLGSTVRVELRLNCQISAIQQNVQPSLGYSHCLHLAKGDQGR